MRYQQSIDNCMSAVIGDSGLSGEAFAAALAEARPALDRLRSWRKSGELPLLALPARRDDLQALAPVAARYAESFDDILVLGTGGSSLGGRALCALARPDAGPGIHFLDNVDPDGFAAMLNGLDLARTGAIVISKSGGTPETMAQFIACLARFRDALGEDALARHVTAITEPADNPMRRLAGRFDIPLLDHDPGIGGRYAALSLVGLLPAAIAGLDPGAVRQGARDALEAALGDPADSAPAAGAALSVGLARDCGVRATVVMPYVDRLALFARWHRQLWAESLGKGGHGTTPLDALGTVDQHSQLQLWLDGPADKMFTLIAGPAAGRGDAISTEFAGGDPALDWLAGRTLGDLLDASCRATAGALVARGRPVRMIRLDGIDEAALGALIMHFMLETIVAAHMMGVDPFDQPAVEEGKVLTRQYMEALKP